MMSRSHPARATIGAKAGTAIGSAIGSLATAALVAVPLMAAGTAGPARAQASSCEKLREFLSERQELVKRVNGLGKKVNAKDACAVFGQLVSNGSNALKWVEANKDWCQIPDQFSTGLKNDHEKAVSIRGRACQVAAQQAQMEKRAKEGGGLLGGGGGDILTGPTRIPQGAL
ncbi:hypothetical protein QNA08_17545 [Chelatococcus sp. SYSU_G07232]|uniref:Uncharacterized protein n=1 Tax=Chelatococcus albus TaxID=3047466 RepID=A0ABT7AKW1_9HYPH|nr:hypothetical protein [Chelatococcus sp. SYSU_G07232]MDJ1160021.1 hypothetical protein [Chelatococcus sp. SYSU_G07232]